MCPIRINAYRSKSPTIIRKSVKLTERNVRSRQESCSLLTWKPEMISIQGDDRQTVTNRVQCKPRKWWERYKRMPVVGVSMWRSSCSVAARWNSIWDIWIFSTSSGPALYRDRNRNWFSAWTTDRNSDTHSRFSVALPGVGSWNDEWTSRRKCRR